MNGTSNRPGVCACLPSSVYTGAGRMLARGAVQRGMWRDAASNPRTPGRQRADIVLRKCCLTMSKGVNQPPAPSPTPQLSALLPMSQAKHQPQADMSRTKERVEHQPHSLPPRQKRSATMKCLSKKTCQGHSAIEA